MSENRGGRKGWWKERNRVGGVLEKRGGSPKAKGPCDSPATLNSLKATGSPTGENIFGKAAEKLGQGVGQCFHRCFQQQRQLWRHCFRQLAGCRLLHASCRWRKGKQRGRERKGEEVGRKGEGKRTREKLHLWEHTKHSLGTARKIWEIVKSTKFLQLHCRDSELSIFRY